MADLDNDYNELDLSDDQRAGKPIFRRFNRRRPKMYLPDYVDWKDVDLMRRFIPERGKIMPRRISGLTAKQQRKLQEAIKRARKMALIPYVAD